MSSPTTNPSDPQIRRMRHARWSGQPMTIVSQSPEPSACGAARTAIELSVVIPVYNSSTILPRLLARLRTVLDKVGMSYEIVLVEDGSPDESWRSLVVAAKAGPGPPGGRAADAQLRSAQRADVRFPPCARFADRYHGRRLAASAGRNSQAARYDRRLAIWTWCTAATTRRSIRR